MMTCSQCGYTLPSHWSWCPELNPQPMAGGVGSGVWYSSTPHQVQPATVPHAEYLAVLKRIADALEVLARKETP